MFVPLYLQRWALLNAVRLLTITACALVMGATIELLCRDFAAYHNLTSSLTAGYHTGTDIPTTFLGVFWTTLHQTYLVMVLFFVLLSELSLPVPTLHRFFKNFLPFLGPNWGTGFLGAMLVLLASDTLSRSSQRRFPLASSWILAITGVFNIVTGLVWRAKGKMLRSPTAWKHSVAQRMDSLADIKARAETFSEKEVSLPLHQADASSRLPHSKQGVLRSVLQKFRPSSGSHHASRAKEAPKPTATFAIPPPIPMPAAPAQVVTRGEPAGPRAIAIPAAVPFIPSHVCDIPPVPSANHPTSLLNTLKSLPLTNGLDTDTGDSSFRSSHRTHSSLASSCSSRSSHNDERGGRAALLEALSEHCRQASSDSNYSAAAPALPRSHQLKSVPNAKAVRFESPAVSHYTHHSVSSIYTDQGLPLLPAFESRDSTIFPNDKKESSDVEELLSVEPALDEPQLSPSVVASYKAAMLEAEAKARCQKLKKSLYLGSDKWLAERRKDAIVPDSPASPTRPYKFL